MEDLRIFSPRSSGKKTAYASSDEYERQSPEKYQQREAILEFIKTNMPHPIRYIGLPGKYWQFENMLHHEDKNAIMTGVEQNGIIFERSKIFIPSKKLRHNKRIMNKNVTLEFYSSKPVIYARGRLSTLTDKETAEICTDSGTYEWAFTKRNAVWYDFTGSMNKETYLSLYNINNVIYPGMDVPICLTIMYGRDLYMAGEGEEGRIEIMKKAIHGFEAIDVSHYRGFENTRMMTIFGIRRGSR